MASSKYKIVKEGWGNRPNFQASYGLGMTPEDIESGNAILEAMLVAEAGAGEIRLGLMGEEATVPGSKGNGKGKGGDGSSGGARGRRFEFPSIKYGIGEALAEQYGFTSTGDDETDMIIAIGLRDLEEELRDLEEEDRENSDEDLTGIGSSRKSEQAIEPQGGSGEKKNRRKRRNRKKKKN